MGKITVQFSRWTADYLFSRKDQALASLQAYMSSMVTCCYQYTQQIGVFKRVGADALCDGPVLNIDSGLSPNVRDEFMLTKAY